MKDAPCAIGGFVAKGLWAMALGEYGYGAGGGGVMKLPCVLMLGGVKAP